MKLPRGRATDVIAAITALAFLIVQLSGYTDQAVIFGGFIPARVHEFAAQQITLDMFWLPVWLTPLSATLIHGGWVHIGFNLLTFVFCARQVEHLLGPWRLVIIYLVGAYASAFAQWAWDPASVDPMIGASGAVSAVIGTYAIIYSRREVAAIGPIPPHYVRMAWLAAAWIAIQLLIGFGGLSIGPLGGIAIWAHVGGFLAGLVLARPMLSWRFGGIRPI